MELKELTNKQKEKADKIIELLIELKKSGVHPLVLDGGGGSGLEFIRCSMEDKWEIGEILLGHDFDKIDEIKDVIYTPKNYGRVNIDYIVP